MSDTPSETQRAGRLADIEHLLATRGHDLGVGRVRLAAGRSGIALGFPRDPIVHVSWTVVGVLGVLSVAWLERHRSRKKDSK